MSHFRQPENFTSPFQPFSDEHSWTHAASQDAYARGAYHLHRRGHQEHSAYLPEMGIHGQEHRRHRFEGAEGRHQWRRHHHGPIGRSLGDATGGPQNYSEKQGDNWGFPGFGDQSQTPGFGEQPQLYGRQRGIFPGSSFAPPDNGQEAERGPERRSRRNSYNPPDEGTAPEYHGRTGGRLTAGQQAFAHEFAAKTGLNENVVGNWLLKEESGRAAQIREAHGNMNWLNIGYTDRGHRGTGNEFWYNDPVKAADISAAWMKGEVNVPGFGRASHGIRRIQDAVGQSPETQMAMIANSGWASSHYGYGQQVAGLYHHHRHNYLANEYASRSHYQPWRYRYERG